MPLFTLQLLKAKRKTSQGHGKSFMPPPPQRLSLAAVRQGTAQGRRFAAASRSCFPRSLPSAETGAGWRAAGGAQARGAAAHGARAELPLPGCRATAPRRQARAQGGPAGQQPLTALPGGRAGSTATRTPFPALHSPQREAAAASSCRTLPTQARSSHTGPTGGCSAPSRRCQPAPSTVASPEQPGASPGPARPRGRSPREPPSASGLLRGRPRCGDSATPTSAGPLMAREDDSPLRAAAGEGSAGGRQPPRSVGHRGESPPRGAVGRWRRGAVAAGGREEQWRPAQGRRCERGVGRCWWWRSAGRHR